MGLTPLLTSAPTHFDAQRRTTQYQKRFCIQALCTAMHCPGQHPTTLESAAA
jgi:hypothetical protein